MHYNLRLQWNNITARKANTHNGHVIAIRPKQYIKENKSNYGSFVAQVWFAGIQDNHNLLKITEGSTWSEVSAAACNIVITKQTLSKHLLIYSAILYYFLATIKLTPSKPIYTTLLELKQQNLPTIFRDYNFLLAGRTKYV